MKHSLNENYFEHIDSPEKAYWLGYIYADGHVAKKAPWFVVLQTIDIAHLNKLKHAIAYTGDIAIKSEGGGFPGSKEMGRLVLCRKKLCTDLASHNCASPHTTLPQFSSEWMPSFIRGLFDGDGCTSVILRTETRQNKTYGPYRKNQCNIILHIDILEPIKTELLPVIGHITVSDSKTEYMKYIRWSSQKACDNFAAYIYSQQGPCLERKKNNFNT